ncbi:MAG: helicase-related protein [Bryobacterales bacterium]|nr:helicase-related protein [Bryobacterales bacterium]
MNPRPLDFSGDPERLSLFVEGLRLSHGYQFNPTFASEISQIHPLPHQRIAVYDHMLREDPLRFLLADDAGAGKTIMTGLCIREMLMRGRIRRVLIVPPAGLVGNWEQELRTLFRLQFRITSGSDVRTHNPFSRPDGDLVIVSLDTLRGQSVFAALASPETVPYDLVVFDEAHKLSASAERGRVRKTQRYKLAEALAGCPPASEYATLTWSARNLLLLTATPHMGKDSPYHHLWRLLDHHVFGAEEAFRRAPRSTRIRHFIRRTKEEMVDFDGRPVFRERHCDTFGYDLTPGEDGERDLYDRTTSYLLNSYNQAKENQQAVRLAMGVFQRRLASSTWALLKSLERRVAKVSRLVRDLETGRLDLSHLRTAQGVLNAEYSADYFDEHDASEDLDNEALRERSTDYEDAVLGAVVAVTTDELRAEILTLEDLCGRARRLIASGYESKFERLREVIEHPLHSDEKWLIFSEHRDTVDYLIGRLEELGYAGLVASIHGGMPWQEREEQVDRFRDSAGAQFLVATDAAGEGINLQFCRLMVNYDIPWNPARLEQRMGRIHRYGQKHDVRIVNLVSTDTREGRVLQILLERLDAIRQELHSDKVFDVIGRLFQNQSLSDCLREALSDEGERRSRARLETALTKDAVGGIGAQDRKHYGSGGDVVGRLGTLRSEIDRERYVHLLPAYVRRFVERASPILGLAVSGDLDEYFSLVPTRPGALDPLLRGLEAYPVDARERLRVRRPGRNDRCVWLHPGEPVFDALSAEIAALASEDALRGSVFVDSRAESPYMLHLGEVGVEEEEADTSSSERETVFRELVVLCQEQDGGVSKVPLESFAFLQDAPHVPPGAVPLAARALGLRADAGDHLQEEAARLASNRRAALRARLPERRRRVGLNFNLRAADLARRRKALSKDGQAATDERAEVRLLQMALWEQRRLEFEKLDTAPERIVPSAVRFLAHALVLPATGDEEREAFDADIERVAMAVATEWERSRGSEVTDVSTPPLAREARLADHPGFDLLATDVGGERRHIEVKGRAQRGGVWMEENEYRAACNLGADYWLYVVLDCATSAPHLSRVRDPFARLLAKGTIRMRISAAEVLSAAEAHER